jgi:hypothetical protein
MRAFSFLSATFGLLLLLIGLGWLVLVLTGAAQAQRAGDVSAGLALLFQTYGGVLLILGLVLCALAGIEATLALILAELRRNRAPES